MDKSTRYENFSGKLVWGRKSELKIMAAQLGVTMQDLLDGYIEKGLEEDKEKLKKSGKGNE